MLEASSTSGRLELEIEKLNEKGYGVAQSLSKTYFVSNALPGETVIAQTLKKKKKINYSLAIEIIKPSKYRIAPKDEAYLSTSPWQIMKYVQQLIEKKKLIEEYFSDSNSFKLPPFEVNPCENIFEYRNKVEYSFYLEDKSISLSFYKRDSKNGKTKVDGTSLVPEAMNSVALDFQRVINLTSINPKSLKSLVIRSSIRGEKVYLGLYVKDPEFKLEEKFVDELFANEKLASMEIIFSDPKSPASLVTERLFRKGDESLVEVIDGLSFSYKGDSFFQVNPEMFEIVLSDMKRIIEPIDTETLNLLDIYAGVGVIGQILASNFKEVMGVELTPGSRDLAMSNARVNRIENYSFIEGKAEELLNTENVNKYQFIVLDPPRSGVHPKLVKKIIEANPKYLLYMSCNPKTQAHDLAIMQEYYELESLNAYDFYPNTPHVESLAFLKSRSAN